MLDSSSSAHVHRVFHETWLGECQPSEGLTFSVPVLCDAGVMNRLSVAQARGFAEFVERIPIGDADEPEPRTRARLVDLRRFLLDFCGWTEDELHGPERMPAELVLRLAEEGTELRPSLAIPYGHREGSEPIAAGEHTPISRAAAAYQLLVWVLPPGLDLDAPESETTSWHYPPAAKFERLLREARVPLGLLCNGDQLRLVACPQGATGWIAFTVDHMASPAGRDMLSALRELLHADRVLGAMPGTPTTLELVLLSRERQADVTTRLGEQALDALQILLEGFEAASRRDGELVLREAMRQAGNHGAGNHGAGNHVYEGLLTVVLRLIFALYAEDRGLLPVEHPLYAAHLGVGGLYDALVADADLHGDTMDQRFGAWPRLLMLFRALYFGLQHDTLVMPAHRGTLFDPERHPFLEGRLPGGGAPVAPDERAGTRMPTLSDGVVLRVLRRLLVLDGQRLSYGALEEEQLGSVYESLMGYAVERRMDASVCLAPSRVWVGARELLERPKATRLRFLKDAGVDAGPAKRIVDAVEQLEHAWPGERDDAELHEQVLACLRECSPAGRARRGSPRSSHAELAVEVEPDRLVIQPGEARRRTSSHYTPRSLSGPIVARTLEPLLAAIRARIAHEQSEQPELPDPQPRAADILALEVCDPAMGSGAFLVESCRFLARHLVAAWMREGTLERELAAAGDALVQRKPEQLALRMVAQHCLFGVDKNPLAVELGKLSLWLLTLARGQTFTFLDHCLKAGDSLVGLSRAQILALDWAPESDPHTAPLAETSAKKKASKTTAKKKAGKAPADALGPAQLGLFADQTKRAFAKAALLRQQLAELARSSDRDAIERRQHELHVEAERALARLRDVADIVLSTYFFPFDTPEGLAPEFLCSAAKVSDKQRRDCLARVRDELDIWLMSADAPRLPPALALRRDLVRETIRPMHWELEFPEVFASERPDPLDGERSGRAWVDAVVGNPPFSGKNGITEVNGSEYLSWLGLAYAPSHGNSDLSAYFFRRAAWLLGRHGTLGLIATNTIGQGDTRTTGLAPLVAAGAKIYDATRDLKWPVKGANVSVSIVHLAMGVVAQHVHERLDGEPVPAISTQLRGAVERAAPVRLAANQGKSFQGSIVLGQGFVLTPEERDALVKRDARNAERIFPYLGGQELNTSPTQEHDRYVINFGELTLEEAEQWPILLEILRTTVKPERDRNNRETYRRYWWQFAEKRPALALILSRVERCLIVARTTKHLGFAFQPANRVFSENVVVFPFQDYAYFGLLQSRIHARWVALNSSTLETRQGYRPSDCFETFPFPDPDTLAPAGSLSDIAERLYETRAAHMRATGQGLTKTYNALTDPSCDDADILTLRLLHVELDRAVLAAYGQSHIAVPAYAGAPESELATFEDAVLDFLFARNTLLARRT